MTSDYIPDDQDLTACPGCGSGRLLCMVGTDADLDLCADCGHAWERLPPGEPYTTDGEQLPFAIPCDNCAFRGGSAERADPDAWAALQHILAVENGGRFYCHKAVPFAVMDQTKTRINAAGECGFIFPRKAASVTVEGKAHAYQQYDTERMRLCRGYLNAHVGPLVKRVFAEETPVQHPCGCVDECLKSHLQSSDYCKEDRAAFESKTEAK